MEYQQVGLWTIVYNSNGHLAVAPIMISYEKKAFSPAVDKKQQNIYEIASSLHATIYLVGREKFPEMDKYGNYKLSPTCQIKDFIVQCSDICAAHSMLEIIKK